MIGLLLATVYFLWLGTLIFRSFSHIEAMNTEYIFIMVITMVTIVGAMSAVYTGALAPDQVSRSVITYIPMGISSNEDAGTCSCTQRISN